LTQPSSKQKGTHVSCGQTAGWIKMLLGMEVGLGPGHIVLDGDPAPPKGLSHCVRWGHSYPKRAQPPIFSPCLLWPNGCPSQLLLSTRCGCTIGQAIIFLSCDYYLSCSVFSRLFSAVTKWMSTIPPHMMWP